jgi:quinol monooxygenase YgiN
MIVVTGRVQIPQEHRDRFVEVASQMCATSRAEEGCFGYRAYADLELANRYVFVEEWVDDAALQRHFGEAHTRAFLGDLGSMLGGPADVLFHTIASTRRLEAGRGLVAVD